MQIGFIGLGTMGAHMAGNLQKAGHASSWSMICARTRPRRISPPARSGPTRRARSPQQSDVIFTSLPEPPDVEKVALAADGLLAGIKPGAAWFDLSTNSPSLVKKLYAAFAEKGAHMLDAPVSGGPQGAASRKLAIWVGGEQGARSTSTRRCSTRSATRRATSARSARATVAKLVHNMSGYAVVCALAETFAMGVKAGVEPLALWEAVRQGAAGRRYTFDALINQWLPGKYDPPDFSLKLAHKDVGLATALGRELGLPMRICELAYAEMTEAINRGWAGRDSRVVMLLEQERAGIEVKVDPERLKEALAKPFPSAPKKS